MHCDWLKKVTGHEAMCQGLRETACKLELRAPFPLHPPPPPWTEGQKL